MGFRSLGTTFARIALGLALWGLAETTCLAGSLPVSAVRVVNIFPHDASAFTEGLFFHDGYLFESTGLTGRSEIRKVRLSDGAVLLSNTIPSDMFGEGIVNWGNDILSLTWQDQIGFRWDGRTLARTGSFRYLGEGWGLTHDERNIIMSDGSSVLRFLDPLTLKQTRRLAVRAEGRPLDNLNELEWVRGEILANIWLSKRIARIDPTTGNVTGWIDLSGLPEIRNLRDRNAIANGIAYDSARNRLFVTGKNWPRLYEIELVSTEKARR